MTKLGRFVIVQGIPTSNYKKPYIFVIVQASSGNDRDSEY